MIRSVDASDVLRCITFARQRDLPLSVRGGGHSVAGNAVRDGAVMVDLSGMKALRLTQRRGRSAPNPGSTLGEVRPRNPGVRLGDHARSRVDDRDRRAHARRRAGLAQRPLWLACDNLISADVATADGQLLRASAQENEDLFWSIRGGGGNFGVVTLFEYQLHPVDLVLAGVLSYPLAMAPRVLRHYDDFAKAAPDELSTAASLGLTPAGEPTVSIAVCYCGPIDVGEQVLRPLRRFQSPVDDGIRPMPYTVLQSTRDEGFLRSTPLLEVRLAARCDRRRHRDPDAVRLADALIGQQRRAAAAARSGEPGRPIGHRLPTSSRAVRLPHPLAVVGGGRLRSQRPGPGRCSRAMQPHLEVSVYVNSLGDEGPGRVREAYGQNYPRLAAMKRTYDPDNLFRANQNIDPSTDIAGGEN